MELKDVVKGMRVRAVKKIFGMMSGEPPVEKDTPGIVEGAYGVDGGWLYPIHLPPVMVKFDGRERKMMCFAAEIIPEN